MACVAANLLRGERIRMKNRHEQLEKKKKEKKEKHENKKEKKAPLCLKFRTLYRILKNIVGPLRVS